MMFRQDCKIHTVWRWRPAQFCLPSCCHNGGSPVGLGRGWECRLWGLIAWLWTVIPSPPNGVVQEEFLLGDNSLWLLMFLHIFWAEELAAFALELHFQGSLIVEIGVQGASTNANTSFHCCKKAQSCLWPGFPIFSWHPGDYGKLTGYSVNRIRSNTLHSSWQLPHLSKPHFPQL